MVEVIIENVRKVFGGNVVALDNINIKIKDGEFFVLLGPSGSGKTTLLRCVAGLEKPDQGRIIIGDKVVFDAERKIYLSPKDRDIAMVFQNYALYPHMKVFDNIAFPLVVRRRELKLTREDIRKRVVWVAKMLNIDNLLDRYPRQLSGGQQQRVALARALVRSPNLFLMDEPLSNIDAKLRVMMRSELKKLQKELGITTIYVTHDQAEAMTMADRIAVLNKGKIMQIGSPSELYHKPKNLFVAGFIGSPPMNFIDVTLKESDHKYYLDAGPFKIILPDEIASIILSKTRSSELILGVRPEDIIVSKEPLKNAFTAEVYVVEPLGSHTIVNIKIGERIIKAEVLGEFIAQPGEKIYVKFNINKIHVFDKSTDETII